MTSLLSIDKIRLDGGTQVRIALNEEYLAELQLSWEEQKDPPSLTVFFDGKEHWLADGFHRLESAKRAERIKILCEVRQGTLRDAILYSARANARHGLRLSNADKRHNVERFLKDVEWSGMSDRWIAEVCFVTHPFVAKVRRDTPESYIRIPEKRKERQVVTVTTPSRKPEQNQGLTLNENGIQEPLSITDSCDASPPSQSVVTAYPPVAQEIPLNLSRLDLLESLLVAVRAYLSSPDEQTKLTLLSLLSVLDTPGA